MRRLFILLPFALACGAAKPVGDEAAAPSCAVVAQHMLELAVRGEEVEPDGELAAGVRAEHERQCRDDAWSVDRRRCLAQEQSQEAAARCPQD